MDPQSQQLLIAVTTVAGATKACAARGDAAMFATVQAYYALAAESATAAGGRFVKAMGDGVLLTFPPDRADAAVIALRDLEARGTALWRGFDERCHVMVKGRVGPVLVGMLGAPGEERLDLIGNTLNALFKEPWQDFDVRTNGQAP